MIKEDEIRGNGTGYNQVISGVYTGNPSHIFSGKKNPMVGYPHEDVIVAIPSGAWGYSRFCAFNGSTLLKQ